ncbi:TetR/AcrR family transcriptional regulator [Frankia sp. AgB1.9]|uniref:TetR/AcrR family transcriptional regulator n=1 Tax=unclassified Frankia TaxID=2632575 RepID=UPI001931AE2E|nr:MULTISPECIES: helix-turn-helix domain-containing protein [unclassified Frankia]MBL7487939.1 TetR/AcrR family transcriptional regulator [Frankia sp. AgW1.1]MBL7550382.1 TetR/AcrR family transcriptional regulator [Frankia sp. AgB1.9]MBL7620852.1 TetR/AcrR family transcriptional regulator [Frankia sp. AgB1.8]
MARGDVRARMVAGAVRLLATKGLEGTSFAEVLAATGAPRGSTYHHFPGGKTELVGAALTVAGEYALAAMEPVRGQPAPVVVRQFLALWRQLLAATELRAGCAVLAVTVAADDADLLAQAGQVFRAWRGHLAALLTEGGMTEDRAHQLAALTIAASEGAVALARAERDWAPFDLVESSLIAAAEQASQS